MRRESRLGPVIPIFLPSQRASETQKSLSARICEQRADVGRYLTREQPPLQWRLQAPIASNSNLARNLFVPSTAPPLALRRGVVAAETGAVSCFRGSAY